MVRIIRQDKVTGDLECLTSAGVIRALAFLDGTTVTELEHATQAAPLETVGALYWAERS